MVGFLPYNSNTATPASVCLPPPLNLLQLKEKKRGEIGKTKYDCDWPLLKKIQEKRTQKVPIYKQKEKKKIHKLKYLLGRMRPLLD